MTATTEVVFDPLLAWTVLAPLFAIAVLALLATALARARGLAWRTLVALALAVVLVNPSVVQEERQAIDDVAVIVVDRSPSQSTGDRRERTDQALQELQEQLGRMDDIEVRLASTADAGDGGAGVESTRLFETFDRAVSDIPRRRLAGVVLLTDGQVHDVPRLESLDGMPPVHTLLTGPRDEADRRLSLVQAPAFGLVGQPVTVTLRAEDLPARGGGGSVTVSVSVDGRESGRQQIPLGVDADLYLMIDHGGTNVFEIEVEPADQELSLANNRVAVVVNGVRDRLRVLLVSGEPHPGERTWRNILKSDPSVDLVHFTILRPPEKQDGTPINELSLISFPIRELFELRLNEFDLIIFDRYRRRGVLPSLYLANIANYVRGGGAFLEASGPQFASPFSLYRTPLGDVLPGEPTGEVLEEGFRPMLTDLGLRHPVTAGLPGSTGDTIEWGRWFRQVEVIPTGGATVMTGIGAQPLLILDRVGEGRVAQLMSDHIWLWARGFEGGGPQAELLRRLAHWLMQEPALEEEDLSADVSGSTIEVERRSLDPAGGPVTVTTPSGATVDMTLEETSPGRAVGRYQADEPGIFRIDGGGQSALAVVGSPNPPELSDLRVTDEVLQPVADATGGGLFWLVDGMPELRRVRPDRATSGEDWMGMRANGDYLVTGVAEGSLLPPMLVLLLVVGGLMAAWRREGQ
ncbi:MAG: hypothetical protein H6842_07935 [Rhodospirillaceae bacterium]|nr:hypothetical protein [Rhodospirillaceae bacterium]